MLETGRQSAPEGIRTQAERRSSRVRSLAGAVVPSPGTALTARVLVAADAAALLTAFALAERFGGPRSPGSVSPWLEVGLFVLTIPAWILAASWYGLYDRDLTHADHGTTDELKGLFHLPTVAAWLLLLASGFSGLVRPYFPKLVIFWLAAVVLLATARSTARAVLRRRALGEIQNVLVLGAGEAGQTVARKIENHPEYGLRVVGFVDPDPRGLPPDLDHVPVSRVLHALPALVETAGVRRVIVAYSLIRDEDWLDPVCRLRELGVQIDVVPRLFEMVGRQAELHSVEGLQLLTLPPFTLPQTSFAKRLVDLVVSACALVVLAPLFLLIALRVAADGRGPVIYRSRRIGEGGRVITLFKFRTMYRDAESLLDDLLRDARAREEFRTRHKLRSDPRVTKSGRWLRRFSLDELPQFFNVLRGDLSLVGPRPITLQEYEQITGETASTPAVRARPHARAWRSVRGYWEVPGVRPGVTGLWQIHGRSAISYEERVRLDKLYATNWSLASDLLIIAKTLRTVTTSKGAY